jgi:hypothetical protein
VWERQEVQELLHEEGHPLKIAMQLYPFHTMMAKAKPKTKNPFIGTWRIISMSAWDEDYLDEEVQAFIEFEPKNSGQFQFGYVQGEIDYRLTNRDAKPAVEFSWEGSDGADGTPLLGRGWATLDGDKLSGMIFFHGGDDSDFVAQRAGEKKRVRKR